MEIGIIPRQVKACIPTLIILTGYSHIMTILPEGDREDEVDGVGLKMERWFPNQDWSHEMTIRILPNECVTYINQELEQAGEIGALLRCMIFHAPFVFAPKNITDERLKLFKAGGIYGQHGADSDLSGIIKSDLTSASTQSVMLIDPWSNTDDFERASSKNSRAILTSGCVSYLMNASDINTDTIMDYRMDCVGYLKILLLLDAKPIKIISNNIENVVLNKSICLYVNVYDDESWLGASVGNNKMKLTN